VVGGGWWFVDGWFVDGWFVDGWFVDGWFVDGWFGMMGIVDVNVDRDARMGSNWPVQRRLHRLPPNYQRQLPTTNHLTTIQPVACVLQSVFLWQL